MQKQNLGKDSSSQTGSVSQIYDEFCPILLNQFKSRDYTKFETFDASLDEFYSKIESQRSEQQQKAKENSAAQKLNKIRQDQENRVHTLRKEADHCVKMAELIEYNLEDVDAAILAVHVALAKEILGLELAGISPVLYGRNDQLHIFNNKFKAIHSWAFTGSYDSGHHPFHLLFGGCCSMHFIHFSYFWGTIISVWKYLFTF
ncbi:uncharacterized protein [Arachis hypogaea]|uniref:uncharacterized protein n=1 Tax=Arachis hypogaea TaxID=3818 RepID=UPI003B2206C2